MLSTIKTNYLIVLIALFVWLSALIIHMYFYVSNGLKMAGDGYDTDWQFQILSFFVTRMPFYLIGLVFVGIIAFSLSLLFETWKKS
jgi:hypothetical protein